MKDRILSLFIYLYVFLISFSHQTKLVPLSECNIFVFPLQAITRLSTCIKEPVSKLWSYFNVHSLTFHTHKNSSTTLHFVSMLFDNEWAKHINPKICKGCTYASLCIGRSAIFCSPDLLCSLWHFTYLNKKLWTAALQLVIQYPELLSPFRVAPHPPWAYLLWQLYDQI